MDQGYRLQKRSPFWRQVSVRATFSALRHPNYRLWFFGQMVSLLGTWMQSTAQGYLVFELTHSPAYLGYVGFAAGLPAWLFTLYGGFVADRVPRRTLLILTQAFMMILAAVLAALTFSGLVRPWHIIGLAFLLGIANAFDAPARLAFVLELVSREDLTNAVALNATMFNTATAFGPAVAGLTYAAFGPAWCFTINAVSFLAIIAALWMMKLHPAPLAQAGSSVMDGIRQGFRFVRSDRIVRTLILYLAATSLLGMGFVTLMPAWAVKVLGGDATTNGLLQSARGVGALMGALLTAAMARSQMRGRMITLGSAAFPLMLIVFASIHWLPLSMALLVLVGLSQIVYMNNSNSLVQTQTPDELRGRVLSIYSLSFFGLMPVGSLLAGALAAQIGEASTVFLGAGLLALCAGWMWLQVPELRRMV
ncbi:MAG: MFS transporter [Chloroflexota bacterium]